MPIYEEASNHRYCLILVCVFFHCFLVDLCPMQDVVVWFCSLRKKPNIHIKAAINKLSVNIEDIMWSY